jgi:hypothetical protein
MNLDWNELTQGLKGELEKQAGPMQTLQDTASNVWRDVGKPAINFLKNNTNIGNIGTLAGAAANAPFAAAKGISHAYQDMKEGISQMAPIGLAAIVGGGMMGGGNNGGGGSSVVTNNHYGGQGASNKPSMLNYNKAGVTSMGAPKVGSLKLANVLIDPLMAAVERRMSNAIVNKLAPPEAQPPEARSQEEVELISQHPEIAKLLEDEQNKAYLKKLIS